MESWIGQARNTQDVATQTMSTIPIRQGTIRSPVTRVVDKDGTVSRVELAVARSFHVSARAIRQHTREVPILDARTACIALVWDLSHPAKRELERYFGMCHGNTWNALRRHADLCQTDPRYLKQWNAARAALGV